MSATQNFTDGPLYKKLVQVLPIFVQDPFNEDAKLNVQRLRAATGKSHEATYKWLRKSSLTPENADLLVSIANRADNVKVLKTLGRTTPTREDFLPFVFGA